MTSQLTCAIEEVRQADGLVELQSVVRADRAASGTYSFVVLKSDAGGTSNSTQSGRFDVAGAGEQQISTIHLSLMPGGRYEAKLTLDWDGGSVACERTERQDA